MTAREELKVNRHTLITAAHCRLFPRPEGGLSKSISVGPQHVTNSLQLLEEQEVIKGNSPQLLVLQLPHVL